MTKCAFDLEQFLTVRNIVTDRIVRIYFGTNKSFDALDDNVNGIGSIYRIAAGYGGSWYQFAGRYGWFVFKLARNASKFKNRVNRRFGYLRLKAVIQKESFNQWAENRNKKNKLLRW